MAKMHLRKKQGMDRSAEELMRPALSSLYANYVPEALTKAGEGIYISQWFQVPERLGRADEGNHIYFESKVSTSGIGHV